MHIKMCFPMYTVYITLSGTHLYCYNNRLHLVHKQPSRTRNALQTQPGKVKLFQVIIYLQYIVTLQLYTRFLSTCIIPDQEWNLQRQAII